MTRKIIMSKAYYGGHSIDVYFEKDIMVINIVDPTDEQMGGEVVLYSDEYVPIAHAIIAHVGDGA